MREDDWYVSHCPELGVASQGKTIEKALANLQEAAELYLEEFDVKRAPRKKEPHAPILTTFEVLV